MLSRSVTRIAIVVLGLSVCGSALATDWWASEVVSYSRLGQGPAVNPYADPLAVLGKPTTWMWGSGWEVPTSPCAAMIICAAHGVAPNDGIHGSGQTLITSIKPAGFDYPDPQPKPAGHITVRFTSPLCDDSDNWHGKDFSIFGNSFYGLTGGAPVFPDTNAELATLAGYSAETMLVSVSQGPTAQNGWTTDESAWSWYTYEGGPYADDFAPTHAFAWDWVENTWLRSSTGKEVELDFTRPVNPARQPAGFVGRTCAAAIDLYEGSGGGTAFDLAEIPDHWPTDPSGRKWVRYIRVDGAGGEVDAFARVSQRIAPTPVGEVRNLADGTRVVLDDVVVAGETYAAGRFCYIQQSDRSAGIRLMGRVLDRGQKLSVVCGDVDTIDGETVLLATSVLAEQDEYGQDTTADVRPLGAPNRTIAGPGLYTRNLLVRTWGTVKSVDPDSRSFIIDDGTGKPIKCIAPRFAPLEYDEPNPGDPDWGVTVRGDFGPPGPEQYVVVTGISSTEPDGQGGFVPVIRLRDCSDLQ